MDWQYVCLCHVNVILGAFLLMHGQFENNQIMISFKCRAITPLLYFFLCINRNVVFNMISWRLIKFSLRFH